MNTSGLEMTIGKLQRVHDRMKPSVNKAILLDSITQLREQVKLFSMHFVSGSFCNCADNVPTKWICKECNKEVKLD